MRKTILSLFLIIGGWAAYATTCIDEFNEEWNEVQADLYEDMLECHSMSGGPDPACAIEAYGDWVDGEEAAIRRYECCEEGSC